MRVAKRLFLLGLLGLGAWSINPFQHHDKELVFVGSGHKNIYAFALDLKEGTLAPLGTVAEVAAPSFIDTAPNRKFLYAISEEGRKSESWVSSFSIDKDSAALTFINRELTGGAGPCYVGVDPKGKDVLVANYSSGSVAVFPIDKNGALAATSAFVQDAGSSVNPQRQEGPHAHCFVTDPEDHFAFACDLGLDKVMIFKFDPSKGKLVANDPAFASIKPGQGPRHIAFDPKGKFAYVVSEMGSTVATFRYDSKRGILSEVEYNSLLPKEFKGESFAAEVAVHPSGKFVYASNRGDDSIAVFKRDSETGELSLVEHMPTDGRTPRQFEIDPTGAFLLVGNQDSNTLAVFSIDKRSGRLHPVRTKVAVDKPMCIKALAP